MRNWFSRLAVLRPDTPPPAPPKALNNSVYAWVIQDLKQEVARLTQELAITKKRFEHARRAQSAIHRQACALSKDWPQVHRRYFTNEGIAEREAGLPMNPRKQRKK